MNELIFFAGGVLVTVGGGLGYIKYKLLQEKNNFDSLLKESERRYEEKEKLADFYLDAKNKEFRINKELMADYDQLKEQFKQLADEHNELKEKHAPFASLNPFEQQAVSAMTDQSVYNEWLNGAPKEVK